MQFSTYTNYSETNTIFYGSFSHAVLHDVWKKDSPNESLKSNNLNGLSGNMQFEEKNGLRNNLTISVVDNVRNSIDLVMY